MGPFLFCEVECGRGGISGPHKGGKTFGRLGLKGQSDGFSVRNVFEGSFTEEGKEAGNDIFEGGFRFSASEARKKFDSTASDDQGVIGERLGGGF